MPTPPFIRILGDKASGKTFLRTAKAELLRTRTVAENMGVPIFQRYMPIEDDVGGYIKTMVSNGMETIDIVRPALEPPILVEEEEKEEAVDLKHGIYSGLTDFNVITTLGEEPSDVDFLTNFNPTTICRSEFPNDFEPGLSFQDVERLSIPPHPDLLSETGLTGFNPALEAGDERPVSQTNLVRACQYSGPIAEIVAVLLGVGNLGISGNERAELLGPDAHPLWEDYVRAVGFSIQYDFRFSRCHQAVQHPINREWWLLEFSELNGIIARRLPMLRGWSSETKTKDPVLKQFLRKFGGLPSGEAFPVARADILQGMQDNWIVQLMAPTDYEDQFWGDQTAYSVLNNWCFNEDGTEARVTSYKWIDQGMATPATNNCWLFNTYWKMGIKMQFRSVQIETIEEDRLAAGSLDGTARAGYLNVMFYNPSWDAYDDPRLRYRDDTYHLIPDMMDAVVWVGRVNGEWDEIRYRMKKQLKSESSYGGDIELRDSIKSTLTDFVAGHHKTWYSDSVSFPRDRIEYYHAHSSNYTFDHMGEIDEGAYKFYEAWITGPVFSGLTWDNTIASSYDFPPLTTKGKSHKFSILEYRHIICDDDVFAPQVVSRFYTSCFNRNAYIVYSYNREYAWNPGPLCSRAFMVAHKYYYEWTAYHCPPSSWDPAINWNWPLASAAFTGTLSTDDNGDVFYIDINSFYTDGAGSPAAEQLVEPGAAEWSCILNPDRDPEDITTFYLPYGVEKYIVSSKYIRPNVKNLESLVPDWAEEWQSLGADFKESMYRYNSEAHVWYLNYPGTSGTPPVTWNYDIFTEFEAGNPYSHLRKEYKYEVEIAVVGHKVPGGKIITHEYVTDFPPGVNDHDYINSTIPPYIQTPVLGTDAVIYSDQSQQSDGHGSPVNLRSVSISQGILPSEPVLSENTLWYRCAFVGINGPSNP